MTWISAFVTCEYISERISPCEPTRPNLRPADGLLYLRCIVGLLSFKCQNCGAVSQDRDLLVEI